MLEKDSDLMKLVKRIRVMNHLKGIVLKKHQRKLLKYSYNNVINKETETRK